MSSQRSALLSIEGLSVHFGGLKALSDVYLDLYPNEVVGLIGPNGAGKTTLFNSLCGIVPAQGSLSLDGKKHEWPTTDELVDLGIARTLQGVGLFPDLTVLENVMMGADSQKKSNVVSDLLGFSGKSEKNLKSKAIDILESMGVAQLRDRLPHELSYPDSKKVALARALIMEPKLLMLDEPAAGLDQADIDNLATIINEIKKNCAVLVVEHHVDFVGEISDNVFVLNFGKIIASGPFNTVKENPEVLAAYLGSSKS